MTDEEEVQCHKITYFRYEDLRALDGGSDGLAVIVPILKWASNILRSGLVNFTNLHDGDCYKKLNRFTIDIVNLLKRSNFLNCLSKTGEIVRRRFHIPGDGSLPSFPDSGQVKSSQK